MINEIRYYCNNTEHLQVVKAKNVPVVGDYVMLFLKDGKTVVRYKVLSRSINHTGIMFGNMEPDSFVIGVELA